MTLLDTITASRQAEQALRDLMSEIARCRVASEPVTSDLVNAADAAFTANLNAYNAMRTAIIEAQARGDALTMHVPTERSAEILTMEYKPIKRVGGKLVF